MRKLPVYIEIPTSIRIDWMYAESASYETFTKNTHPLEHPDHVYALISSIMATDLIVRSEQNLVDLIISAAMSDFRRNEPVKWAFVWRKLRETAKDYPLSDEARNIINDFMIIGSQPLETPQE